MGTVYGEAEEIGQIATHLITNQHPHLATAKFRFLFRDKASKKGGKAVMGTVKKMSDLMLYLIDVHFLVEVPLEIWNTLDNSKRTALVDHLLERCAGEEDEKTAAMKWSVRLPDVHEFSSIFRRHGAWHDDLAQFATVAKELDLGFMTDEEETEDSEEDAENIVEGLLTAD